MIYHLYKTSTSLLKTLVESHIQKRIQAGKEDRNRVQERYGIARYSRPPGSLIWFHAASVGESLSLLSLINKILKTYKNLNILVTTGTTSSALLMERKLPPQCVHQYVPFDVIDWVKSFLDHWKPDLAIWVESEFWPNLLYQSRVRKIPMVLLNSRISDQSYKNWQFFKFISKQFLNHFDMCLAQSRDDERKLKGLGAKKVVCYGNLKYASAPLACDQNELTKLRQKVKDRPLWVAASTHRGEEEHVLEAHAYLKRSFPNILTILIPRHPDRGKEISDLLKARSLDFQQRSKGEIIQADTEVYLADTLGELGLFYHLTSVAFVGGSLMPVGGHNIIEPAQLECAVLHGPVMTNFKEMAVLFHAHQAALEVKNGQELAEKISQLMKDKKMLARYQTNARQFAESQVKVIDSVMQELLPYLRSLDDDQPQRTSILV